MDKAANFRTVDGVWLDAPDHPFSLLQLHVRFRLSQLDTPTYTLGSTHELRGKDRWTQTQTGRKDNIKIQ